MQRAGGRCLTLFFIYSQMCFIEDFNLSVMSVHRVEHLLEKPQKPMFYLFCEVKWVDF